MGYYGASVYRGDYYGQRGDYYHNTRGDPGFFDFITDVGKAIVNPLSKIPIVGEKLFGLEGLKTGLAVATGQMTPAQALQSVVSSVLQPGAPIPSPKMPPGYFTAPVWAAAAPGTGSTQAMIPATPQSFTGLQLGGPKGVQIGRSTPMPGGSRSKSLVVPGGVPHLRFPHHRRMNPLNPRALSRALRRARGFQKYATKVLKLVGEKRHVAGFKHSRKRKR